jgi:hypothetical protein
LNHLKSVEMTAKNAEKSKPASAAKPASKQAAKKSKNNLIHKNYSL